MCRTTLNSRTQKQGEGKFERRVGENVYRPLQVLKLTVNKESVAWVEESSKQEIAFTCRCLKFVVFKVYAQKSFVLLLDIQLWLDYLTYYFFVLWKQVYC